MKSVAECRVRQMFSHTSINTRPALPFSRASTFHAEISSFRDGPLRVVNDRDYVRDQAAVRFPSSRTEFNDEFHDASNDGIAALEKNCSFTGIMPRKAGNLNKAYNPCFIKLELRVSHGYHSRFPSPFTCRNHHCTTEIGSSVRISAT